MLSFLLTSFSPYIRTYKNSHSILDDPRFNSSEDDDDDAEYDVAGEAEASVYSSRHNHRDERGDSVLLGQTAASDDDFDSA